MRIENTREKLITDDADLSGSTFHNVKLAGGSFTDVNLSRASFQDINLSEATFRDVNLRNVDIRDCNLTGMTIDGVSVSDAIEQFTKAGVPVGDSSSDATGIRPFHDSDEPIVAALWRTVFNYNRPHNDPVTSIRQKLLVDRELFLVAVGEGEVIGTVMGGYDGHRGWIYSLAVHPEHRRKGLATALVRHVEQLLAARGCLKINLQLLASNAETVTFYEKVGYAVEERISMGKRLIS